MVTVTPLRRVVKTSVVRTTVVGTYVVTTVVWVDTLVLWMVELPTAVLHLVLKTVEVEH